jgi:hypothetical protein
VKDSTREFFQRNAKPVGVAYIVVIAVITAVAGALLKLPNWYMGASVGFAVITFGVFFAWAQSPLSPVRRSSLGRPAPTIREHMKRTRAYFMRITVPIAIAWCVATTFYKGGLTPLQSQGVTIAGGLVIFGIAALFLRGRLNCPRCGSNFSKERIAKVGRWSFDTRGAEDLWDSCPHCGLSFDEPYPL